MGKQKNCKGCTYEHRCRDVYKKLVNFQGASAVVTVCLAFLLPVLVFIISLVFFERILTRIINTGRLQIALAFLLALSATFMVILITKIISKRLCNKG
ncbi:MAG: hypothetical protein A2167_01660 [Planctomycetes bacterium RBG_13_46_10]|nr:MAG: hypothetical protein A2167_01660 [Planctomycetes bacterium RBG_13_46_10]QBM02854.1 hypothetical protein [uncultured archaeon]